MTSAGAVPTERLPGKNIFYEDGGNSSPNHTISEQELQKRLRENFREELGRRKLAPGKYNSPLSPTIFYDENEVPKVKQIEQLYT